ncbi:MAG TPA: type II toxin-antitoxin system PemK/MazF family toxin [Pseudonocardia sp.]|nr:type II toxin-antitoxin system PemK/MazF family toxin [Pseudonocardia sp.]
MAEWGNVLRRAARIGLDLLSGRNRSAPAGPARSGVRTVSSADRADRIVYAPRPDGAADPGEIVWAWVPFEEGDGRGKDRPLLVVGRRGGELAGLMLSSRDRAGDRDWVSIGSGAWDRQGRESFVRLDRVVEMAEDAVRREGAVLDRPRFDRVATELRTRFHWR